MEEEHHRTKGSLQSRIKDREDEIQKLRNQVGHTHTRAQTIVHQALYLHELYKESRMQWFITFRHDCMISQLYIYR